MTSDRRSSAVAETIEALGWCVTIPHTIDQIIGIYAERTGSSTRRMRHGMTNDEIVASINGITGGGGGKGGHSDPTARAALWGEPDAVDDDETVGNIRAAVALCWESSEEIAGICGTTTPTPQPSMTAKAAATISTIHRWAPNLEPTASELHGDDLAHLDTLVRVNLAETAQWLHDKAKGIWDLHRGETLTPAVQRTLTPCACCSEWGYRDHAVPNSDLCEVCKAFRDEHKCWPTKSIRDDRAMGRKRVRPGQLAEAKAAKRPTVKRERKAMV